MCRPPRFAYAGALHRVTLRCNSREFLFCEPWFVKFLDVLRRAREKFPIALTVPEGAHDVAIKNTASPAVWNRPFAPSIESALRK